MEDFSKIIKKVVSKFDESKAAMPFDDLGVDSFDLLAVRVSLEHRWGRKIPDKRWVRFRSFQDIKKFLDR